MGFIKQFGYLKKIYLNLLGQNINKLCLFVWKSNFCYSFLNIAFTFHFDTQIIIIF